MQTPQQKLVVVRDQFALKGLSDDALKQILPVYKEAIGRLEFLLRTMPEGNIQRELWLKTQLATIEAQFKVVADRIYQVLPEAQARAFEEGLTNARKYLEAGGIQPEPALVDNGFKMLADPSLANPANPSGLFISPSITRQQVVAAARETGFSVLSPGGSKWGLSELLPNWMAAESNQVARHLRAGFLVGRTNDEIMREIGPLGPGRKGWAMTEALVRTSMAEASQAAHDAFYDANKDLLAPTESGFRWWWDASNDTRLCPICAPLDGVKFKERETPPHPWPAHFSCRCKILPITATMELLEKEEGEAKGSFLEASPVQYDSKGRRLPPPPGYTGDNAYKRPMKIDGQQQWVRRRDLGPGQTTAGDMLQNANEHSKRMVLGKHTEAFNKLTGKGGQYEKDPQGAVRKLLGNPLPPGSTPPRPTRGPAPKPPAPPKPKTPTYTEEEKARIREETNTRLRARAAAREAAATSLAEEEKARVKSEWEARRAVLLEKEAAKKAAAAAPKAEPKPAQSTEAFIASKQAIPAKAKLTAKDVSEGLAEFAQQDGLRGENMRKMLQFQRDNNIATVWTTGSEKSATQLSHLFTDEVKGSLEAAISRGAGRGVGVTKEILKELESGNLGAYTSGYMRVKRGADGHTMPGFGAIVMRYASHDKAIGATNGVNRVFNAVHNGILNAKDLKPGYTAGQAMYYQKGGKAGARMIADNGWANTYIHEMGHQIHYAAGTPSLPFQGADAVSWLPSKYGGTNNLERFAETFVQYVIDPEGLKAASPGAYKWVDDAVNKALRRG